MNQKGYDHSGKMYDQVMNARGVFYAGIDQRRRDEMSDAGMIREDHTAMANLSPKPINKEFPRRGFYSSPYIDDAVMWFAGNPMPGDEK
jgi:hypothetical protein